MTVTPHDAPGEQQRNTRAPRSAWRRAQLYLRVVLIMCIVTAPALITRRDDGEWQKLTKNSVRGDATLSNASPLRAGDLQVRTALYLAARSPHMDELLPEGDGGTVFVDSLPELGGRAFVRRASIVIAMNHSWQRGIESTEMHERAHLLHDHVGELAARIMAALPSPRADEYAATNSGEHFAEMASSAWDLLHEGREERVGKTPRERLNALEARVPGTSGFLLYYLRHPAFARQFDAASLRAGAEANILPLRDEWEGIWAELDARKLPDGTLQRWPVPRMSEWVGRQQTMLRSQGGPLNHAIAISFWPSAVVLKLLGN
jgi:hypothetical protein